MAQDISNKSLVVLLVLAIAVSLVGTMVSVGRISKMGFPVVSGRGTAGTVELEITQDITLNVTATNVSFGSGSVKAPYTTCWLNTTQDGAPVCWNSTVYNDPAPFVVRNDGNYNITFTVTSTKTGATLIGGTSPDYKFNTTDKDANAAASHTAWTSFDTNPQAAVGNLQSIDTADEVYVHIAVLIPDNAPPGWKTDTITFTSSAATP